MKTFIAKPRSANMIGSKEFFCGYEAVKYLNELLAPVEGDEDYTFVTPKLPELSKLNSTDITVAKKALKKLQAAIEEYQDIGKILVVEKQQTA